MNNGQISLKYCKEKKISVKRGKIIYLYTYIHTYIHVYMYEYFSFLLDMNFCYVAQAILIFMDKEILLLQPPQ